MIKDMPCITVEQVERLRNQAIINEDKLIVTQDFNAHLLSLIWDLKKHFDLKTDSLTNKEAATAVVKQIKEKFKND